jgi:hypothetical protein
LHEFFEGYLRGLLKINHDSIVARRQALLPIIVYLFGLRANGYPFQIKRLQSSNIQAIHQYFILSQFGDWNTQTMISLFAKAAHNAGSTGMNFTLDEIKHIAIQKNRSDTLYYHQFLSLPWLALKILTPNREYMFFDTKPQVDHIFPLGLTGRDALYQRRVDTLWNFQPMPAGINNYKRARHPKEFFESSEEAKYFGDYDFLPKLDSLQWADERKFIWIAT